MDSKEFVETLLPIRDKLFRYAKRVLINYEEAEDIVQEVYLRLWTNREQLAEKKSLEAFAMTMTKNLCIDRYRSKGYQASNTGVDAGEVSIAANSISPQKITEQRDAVDLVKQIVSSLPENMRIVLTLRDVQGLDYDEIAEITGSNINTLKVNLSRARKRVREELSNKYQYKNYED
ncbi:MAG TPA: RNA polymerase sigma factor [Candidatus Kapabacteria bacterium]|nr:RNA polymerase sigma factor [Candidatus Kapabacteria bacterium]